MCGAVLVEAGSGLSRVKRLRPVVGELAGRFSSRREKVHSSGIPGKVVGGSRIVVCCSPYGLHKYVLSILMVNSLGECVTGAFIDGA